MAKSNAQNAATSNADLVSKGLAHLAVARGRACRAQPYMVSALYRLRPVPSPGLGTVAVDPGWRMYFDPEVILTWTPRALAGALLHEVWHLLRQHSMRRGTRAHTGWNVAGDLEINDDLPFERESFPAKTPGAFAALPNFGVHPTLYGLDRGLTAEEYFAAMAQKAQAAQKQAQANGGAGQPGAGDPGDSSEPIDGGQPCAGKCGSGAGGAPSAAEQAAQAQAAARGELPAPVTQAEATVTITATAQAIREASKQAAKGRGSVPAGAGRWAEAALGVPKIPYAKLIRAALDNAVAYVRGQAEVTYTRPARRASAGLILPGRHRPLPEIAIVIDTSGSVDDGLLGLALRETGAAVKSLARVGVTVISCDSAAGKAKRAFDMSGLRKSIVGGGGTDMGVGLEAASKLRPRPSITIVMTDGDTPWPRVAPKCGRVIVALLGAESRYTQSRIPAWATSIVVED